MVAHDVVEVVAQALPGLAGDLVGLGDEAVEGAVLGDPLGGGLGADAGDAGEVVGLLADERGEVAVAGGGDAVLLLDGLGRVPGEFGDALDRVEEGRVLVDELDGVAVARGDERGEPGGLALGGEGGDDVVCLEGVLGEPGDAEGVEELLDDGDLALELLGVSPRPSL
nr:hypothetical protein GCM10025732_29020 [Glycomyces mayteni]